MRTPPAARRCRLPSEDLRVGVVVEGYPAGTETPEGDELEFLSARGDIVVVVSVPATTVRPVGDRELLAVRSFGHS